MVRTVGRKPRQAHRAALIDDFSRLDLPNVFVVMRCARMVRPVHRQRFIVVVDGDIDRFAESTLDAEAGTATAGETVDVD